MKTYFIILLLFAISNCDELDGYSYYSFYNGLDDWLKNFIEYFKCKGYSTTAINTCELITSSNMCEAAISECVPCPKPLPKPLPRPEPTPEPQIPPTPEEIEEARRKLIDSLTNKIYDDYYPQLIELYKGNEALHNLYAIISILVNDPKLKN